MNCSEDTAGVRWVSAKKHLKKTLKVSVSLFKASKAQCEAEVILNI